MASPENDVVPLGSGVSRLFLHPKARVSEHDLHGRAALRQVRERCAGELGDPGIDLVEPEHVTGAAVDRDRPDAKTDRADAKRSARAPGLVPDGEPDAGVRSVVGRR